MSTAISNISGRLVLQNGSPSQPIISFEGSSGYQDGFYLAANGQIGISIAGSNVFTFSSSGGSETGALTIPAGLVSAPSLNILGSTSTGLYSPAANSLAIATNGILALSLDSSQNAVVGGSVQTNAASNQLIIKPGANKFTITAASPAADRVYTLADAGGTGTFLLNSMISADATVSTAGVLTIASSAVTASKISAVNGAVKVQKFTVGFAALNSAGTGVAALFGTAIPVGAIVVRSFINVTSSFTGNGDAGSTIKVGVQDQAATGDVHASGALSVYAAGLVEGVSTGSAATMKPVSTSVKQLAVIWTIGGTDTALTAGAMDVYVETVGA